MTTASRTALLAGCGQVKQKLDDPSLAREPLELMEDAARLAAQDAEAPNLLGALDAVWVLHGIWNYSNPGALLAERLGANRVETGLAPISGTSAQHLICRAIEAIDSGTHDVVLIVGGEAEHSKRKTLRAGAVLRRTEQTGIAPDINFGGDARMVTEEEIEVGLARPASVYSLFENALRSERGVSLRQHRADVATLCSRLSQVAADNPYGWDDAPLSPDEIGVDSESNRMISYPYTKRMVSNMVVDQAAAILVCSHDAARKHGVSPDRCVFPHVAVEVTNTPPLSNRDSYRRVPALGLAGNRALEMAGLSIGDVRHLDIYSCFPAAVQMGIRELDVPDNLVPSLTGGLNHGGGPFNSYVLHSTATAMNRVRENQGEPALVTSLGGWFTKLGFGVYSSEPAPNGYTYACLDEETATLPSRELTRGIDAEATTESYAINYFEGAPHQVVCACLLDDGRRVWTTSEEPDLIAEFLREDRGEPCGRKVKVHANRQFDLR